MTTRALLEQVPDAGTPDRTAQPLVTPRDEVAPPAGRIALVVDDSVAAVAASAWAARLAAEGQTSLVVVLLGPAAPTPPPDPPALLARVQPTLDRSGRPYVVRPCHLGRRGARRVRRLLPDDVGLLVVPGTPALLADLVGPLMRDGDLDLLVVPDLRAVYDGLLPARASRGQSEADRDEPDEATA